jgi:hypothetical protein
MICWAHEDFTTQGRSLGWGGVQEGSHLNENVCVRGITMTLLLFSFCSEELGKEYKYLKNMFHMYQVRFREAWWIMSEKSRPIPG